MRAVLLCSLLWLGIAPAGAAQPKTPPFRAWFWVAGGTPDFPDLRKRLDALGLYGLSAEPGVDAESLARRGVPYYVDQVVSADILAVKGSKFREVMAHGPQSPASRLRPRCLRAAEVVKAAEARISRALAPLSRAPPEFISLRDEPSFTRLLNPCDWCHAPDCLRAYREFLGRRWGGPQVLRRAWGLTPEEKLSLTPRTTHATRRQVFHGDSTPTALVAWNDAREFADATFADALRGFADHARSVLRDVPVGILGGQMPGAFGGYDWGRLMQCMQVVEPYDYGAVRRIIQPLETPRSQVLHTLILAGLPPIACVNELYHYFLRGDRGVVIFSSKEALIEGDWSRPAPSMAALKPHLELLAGPRMAPFRRAREPGAQVAILWSMPTVRYHWLQDTRRDGTSWVRRYNSHEIRHSTQARTRQAWVALLSDLGLRISFVTPSQLAGGVLKDRHFDALVLPRAVSLSGGEARAIRRFATRGGLVVADCQTGTHDGRLRERESGALDDLFGIARPSREVTLHGEHFVPSSFTRELPYPIAEPRLRLGRQLDVARAQRMPLGVPAFVSGGRDGGRTLYLNLFILSYAEDRLSDPARALWLREQLRPHFQHAGIRPLVHFFPDDGSPRWPVETIVRRDGRNQILALHLNVRSGATPVPWKEISKQPVVRGRVSLRGTHRIEDLRTGRKLGPRNEFSVSVRADEPALFILSR